MCRRVIKCRCWEDVYNIGIYNKKWLIINWGCCNFDVFVVCMSMNVIFGYVILCNWLFGVIIEWVVIDEYYGVFYDVYFV